MAMPTASISPAFLQVDSSLISDRSGFIQHVESPLLGYEPAELIGVQVTLLLAEHLRSSLTARWQKLVDTEVQPTYIDTRVTTIGLHKNGQHVPIIMKITPQSTVGTFHIGITSHIPEKRMRERLEFINEMARSVNRLDLEQVLVMAYEWLHRVIQIQHYFVGLYDRHASELQMRAVYDNNVRLPDRVVSLTNEPSFSIWVIENKQTLVLNDSDTKRLPDHIQPYGERTRACIFVPLLMHDEVLGVLSVQSMTSAKFEDADVTMLEALAAQMAVIIHNAQLHAATQKQLEQTAALHLLAENIAQMTNRDNIIETLVTHLHQIFDASHTLLIWDAQTPEDVPSVAAFAPLDRPPELSPAALQQLIKLNESITGFDPSPEDAAAQLLGTKSYMSIPITVNPQTRGVLLVTSTRANRFSAGQTGLLKIAAQNGAAAIRNSLLLAETQQRAADLEQAYKSLQELDQLRQEIVDNVSHELRSPLSYVRAYVGLMTMGEMGEINKKQAEALKIIDRKTSNMLRLINDILEVEKIRPETLQKAPEDIAEIIRQSHQAALMAYMTSGITIELHCKLPVLIVEVDALRIEQVLTNLISNAVKFSSADGIVTIDCNVTDTMVWIGVNDQGDGIPADKLEQIFERFYRVPGVSADGIGIGLSIVKQIIAAHGGEVYVESHPSTGTRFAVGLPLK